MAGRVLSDSKPSELPPRVLQVSQGNVRLVESNGLTGKYVALSYCWGSPVKPPLKTLKSNLQSYQQEIPWHKIPSTFQDTITVARRLDIPYVWIDSLCIVQDDQQDWLSQSKLMGSIYEHAHLTVAASHAEDAWVGFLSTKQAQLQSIELPGFFVSVSSPDDKETPRVFASVRTEQAGDVFPEFGVLNKRAWATQEWLLSRRIVFYTAGQLLWSCKRITQRETGERCFSISRNTHWKSVVEQYSDRTLTYPTDKLIALEGLRIESQGKYGYEYLHGMWKDCMPDHLIWQVTRKIQNPTANDALQLPTWSWAHVSCGVRFLPIRGAKNLCSDISFSDDGTEMSIRSMVKMATVLSIGNVADLTGPGADSIATDVQSTNSQLTETMAKYIKDGQGNAIGWIIFDEWNATIPSHEVYCLALMGGASKRQEEKERRTGIATVSKLRHYWILALRKASSSSSSSTKETVFERTGVGKVYGREFWENAAMKTVVALT
ncbi:heterokaryon incompatibility protein [Pochonia chlamydosporia 170]|uniref:Heterokaryon incompatibility protein n=1 Tax=Pochonia chlamydosporia 170 TaxID=1380566 RepID=A0A179EZS2_METCM|nr:heterokaryon incompatibility protein [Pochonia chlamydosporia 170]OAQ58510.2 heterokaryon incompatibility protein [Pochonia chlamydosporia 170]